MQDPGRGGRQGTESSMGVGSVCHSQWGAGSAVMFMIMENHPQFLREKQELSDMEMQIAQEFGRQVCDCQWG